MRRLSWVALGRDPEDARREAWEGLAEALEAANPPSLDEELTVRVLDEAVATGEEPDGDALLERVFDAEGRP